MTKYALFKDGKQISKAHPDRLAVWVEAIEAKAVIRGRFYNKWGKQIDVLPGEYSIREVHE